MTGAEKNVMEEELCSICGELEPVHGEICGKCYLQTSMEEDFEALQAAEEVRNEQTELMAEILEGMIEAVAQINEDGAIEIKKKEIETITEVAGETYGISFMVKQLNEAEKQAFEQSLQNN